ncbi:UDP-N-acetylmuramyl peptide synthase [Lottiidibacillus patelloidae]|uniref:UDP-N-acetylmuramyl peptide synthase n=1 Tax=Lottiidibacillus patelloidae TaxID=2670334 RepID=A0A263BSW0_9BACI|nr:UDP-N-acetylmuramoyl-L-alanyl-D-glutamate--2,6-diaminopimelate ligase [Lottiidibacillus patelloidae]OZM56662.1 UDP-N-acetylmuramyl peptide synthase [Lottiidibacillus patelloidae]
MEKLSHLLKKINVISTINEKDLTVNGITYHSQKVTLNDVFVCIKGYKTDGHKYIKNAVENGAVAAIVEEFQEDVEIPQYKVENSRIALAQLGAYFYGEPSKKLKMIGITATNGKTTTSYMTNEILENEGLKTGLIGTVAIKIDETVIPAELTTPESLDLQNYLKQMVDQNVSHVTMEVSSAALELHRVEKVDYDIVTFNNFGREHIDMHGTVEKYFDAKSSLIRNASERSVAILNLDCPYSSSLINKTKATTITFGVDNTEGHFYCKHLDLSTGRAKFTFQILKPINVNNIDISPGEFEVELGVPGLHSVYNAMVAIGISLLSGVSVTTIQNTLKQFKGVERRFEFVFEDGIKIIDDHFANPGNINVTLQTLNFMEYEKLHLTYAIRGERGPKVNKENAEAIVNWAKKLNIEEVTATRSISHVTDKDKVTEEELKVFLEVMEQANIKVNLFDELPDATAYSLANASSGDLILLAGCQGMDYGAEIILKQIDEMKADVNKVNILHP